MNAAKMRFDEVIVVDARLADYEPLLTALGHDAVRVHLCSSGEDALRAAPNRGASLWVVNVLLPDMSGIGLLKLIRRRLPRSVVFLVGDTYSAEDELAARTAGATAYVCKPPTLTWIRADQIRGRTPAIRAGPSASRPQP
jgi:two-component system OmpR family response regulator